MDLTHNYVTPEGQHLRMDVSYMPNMAGYANSNENSIKQNIPFSGNNTTTSIDEMKTDDQNNMQFTDPILNDQMPIRDSQQYY